MTNDDIVIEELVAADSKFCGGVFLEDAFLRFSTIKLPSRQAP